jgi:hypothetical protein
MQEKNTGFLLLSYDLGPDASVIHKVSRKIKREGGGQTIVTVSNDARQGEGTKNMTPKNSGPLSINYL